MRRSNFSGVILFSTLRKARGASVSEPAGAETGVGAPLDVSQQALVVVARTGARPRVGCANDLCPSLPRRERRPVQHAFVALTAADAHAAPLPAAAAAAALAGRARESAPPQALSPPARRAAAWLTSRGAGSLRDRQSRSSANGLAAFPSARLRRAE